MKTPTLWQVTIPVCKGHEEAVQALCEDLFQTPACAYTAEDSSEASVSVYLPHQPGTAMLEELGRGLQTLPRAVPLPRPSTPTIQVQRLTARDWVKAWQRHIRPIRIGKVLLIRPTWDKTPPQAGQHLIVLDPGLSFGTGHHPTTHYCLQEVVRLSRPVGASFLDVGTGSGLLAIAAAKLGYARIMALDHDPEAIRVARANARANGVGRGIRFLTADIATDAPPGNRKFEVVAANLTDELLVQQAARIAQCVAPEGRLVLAGILTERFPAVLKTYRDLGFKLTRRRDKSEWTGATFTGTAGLTSRRAELPKGA
ncbi:MAG: 50S ribosomal protein L11 methyltransferase [Verrucomicrobiae bacterium]|nr:50S ribosomal protein L11 methyltransferase [Verrucomicrobiae bacterium]